MDIMDVCMYEYMDVQCMDTWRYGRMDCCDVIVFMSPSILTTKNLNSCKSLTTKVIIDKPKQNKTL